MDAGKQDMLDECVRKYEQVLSDKSSMPYAMIQALNFCVNSSKATTIQAINSDLKTSAEHILTSIRGSESLGDRTLLSLQCLIKIYFRIAQKIDYE